MSLIRAMLACLPASRLSPNCEGSVEQTLYILNSPTYDRAQGKLLPGNSQDLAESSSSRAEFIPAGVGRPQSEDLGSFCYPVSFLRFQLSQPTVRSSLELSQAW